MAVRRPVRSALHLSVLALVACLPGCPSTPPSLPGPGLGSTGTPADTGSGDTDPDPGSTSRSGTEGSGSGDTDTSGAPDDDTGTDTGSDDDGPPTSCAASPQRCTAPSPYEGAGDCDPYVQDCPAGEKCMPVLGAMGLDATACRQVTQNPGQQGDACTIDGELGSGNDTCGVGLMCWPSDTAESGFCAPLCGCGPESPTCPAPAQFCTQSFGGAFAMCFPACDPVQQGCAASEGCYPTQTGGGFACAPQGAPRPTSPGDGCNFLNACSAGQACVGPELVPGCNVARGCCARFCDVADPSGCSPGEQCLSWWQGAEPPPDCPANVGVCAVPM
jgi:hypothetical protein